MTAPDDQQPDPIDWRLTTWDGARREQLRRWAALPLERILLAQEEMREIAEQVSQRTAPPKASVAPTD